MKNTITLLSLLLLSAQLSAKPLKVFILAGQSNMEGPAQVATFDYLGDDPATAPLLGQMRGEDGQPRVCDHVWISYLTGANEENFELKGKLTAGYGSLWGLDPTKPGDKIGPEFTFGLTLESALDEPVLIIKTAWGGKSLHTDFRPPSAGPYVLNDYQRKLYYGPKGHGVPEDMDQWLADKQRDTGRYYRLMIEHVRNVLRDLKRVCPEYAEGQGYELAGLVWFQGWNDLVDGHTYPERGQPGRFDQYSELLAHFIRDVRQDLGAPKLPFVIGVLGVDGAEAGQDIIAFREAMTAPARLPEFIGNVTAVPTAPFWSEELGAIAAKHEQIRDMAYRLERKDRNSPNRDGTMTDAQQREYLEQFEADLISPEEAARWKRGASNAGYHYLGCAKTFALMGQAFALAAMRSPAEIQHGEMAGYLLVPNEKVPESYNAGFSMYVAAWPLLKAYPGPRFQTGLFGTWMFAHQDAPLPFELYSDIEGGLGWWRDTRFATETPKFIMGGVAPNFSEWANGPGAGKGRDWDQPAGKYGVAQLSPWLLWPPDGLNLKQGTCGELFGYGYLPLPLTEPKSTTAGKKIRTGNQSWTLFLNTVNFKGPVAFFTPFFWSRAAVEDPRMEGLLLDSRPSDPNRALQMETQHVPSVQTVDATGRTYARIAPTRFPRGPGGDSLVVHRITAYDRTALWDAVKTWFEGGPVASGRIHEGGAALHTFPGRGGATWRIYPDESAEEARMPVAWDAFATPMAADKHTFGYRWNLDVVQQTDSKDGPLVTLPETYRLVTNANAKVEWVPVRAEEVPTATGLAEVRFGRPAGQRPEPYVTPDDPESCWKKPGPVAGPFQAALGDGSVVTYFWYRFADQPAMLNADLTDREREALQARVEKLHRTWKQDRDYLPRPAMGKLAELDPALIVTPPSGLEVGYVPIVTRQAVKEGTMGSYPYY